MNVYEVRHEGHYLSGVSIVVAKDEARAEHLTKLALVEHGLPAAHIWEVRKLNVEAERCFVLNNGDY
jgi:hypothetical protein